MARWTPEEDATLADLLAQGLGSVEIGSRLTRTPKAVIDRARKIGVNFDAEACKRRRIEQLRRLQYGAEFRAMRQANAAKKWTPESRAAMAEWARKHRAADLAAIARSPEGKARSGALMKRHLAAKLAWCPEELRAEYRRLLKTYSAKVARQKIEAKMTPFERQLSRVRGGARIEARPVLVANDLGYSPIGCALA